MAEEQQDPVKSYFPLPPQYYQHFTDDKAKALEQSQHDEPTPRVLELPAELRYLIPPVEPIDGKWKNFGEIRELHPALPSLEHQGIERLYPTIDDSDTARLFQKVPSHLNRITRSILANYLELLGILAIDPAQAEGKVKVLLDLFINGEHLINLYRPHQARESLVLMMEEQLEQKQDIISRVRVAKRKLEATLAPLMVQSDGREVERIYGYENYGGLLAAGTDVTPSFKRSMQQRNLWIAINELGD